MDKFFEKLSLYDILSMVIPGGIILLFFLGCCGFDWRVSDVDVDSKLIWGFGLVVSYIIGMGNHAFSKKLWKKYRNNPLLLKHSLKGYRTRYTVEVKKLTHKINCDDCEVDAIESFLRLSVSIIAVLLVLLILGFWIADIAIPQLCTKVVFLLAVASLVIVFVLWLLSHVCLSSDNSSEVQDKYNEAYTYVLQRSKNGEIPVIEGQIAFLQSMILPIALMLALLAIKGNTFLSISGCCKCCAAGCSCPFVFGGVLVWLLLFTLIYERIMKVHSMVWDYYEYTKRIENHDTPPCKVPSCRISQVCQAYIFIKAKGCSTIKTIQNKRRRS